MPLNNLTMDKNLPVISSSGGNNDTGIDNTLGDLVGAMNGNRNSHGSVD